MIKTIKTLLFTLSFGMVMFLTANYSYAAYYFTGSLDVSNVKHGNTIGSVQITTNCYNVDPSKEFTVDHVYDITTGTRVEQTTSDTFIEDHMYEFLGHLTCEDSYITSDVYESTNSSFHKYFNVIRECEDGTPEINESWSVDNGDDTFTSYFDFALQTINEDGKIKFDAISKTYEEIVGAMVTGDDCKYYSEGLKDTSFVILMIGQYYPEYLGEGLVQVCGVLPSSIESKDQLDSILYNGINIFDNFIEYNPSDGPSKELFEEAKVKPVYTFVNEDNLNKLYIFAWSNATTGVDFTISPMEIGTKISDIIVASDNIDDALALFDAVGMGYDEDFLSLNVYKYDETEGEYILVEDTGTVLESDGKYLFEIVYEIGIPFMYGINKATINGVTINQSADTEHDYFMLDLEGDCELFIGQYVDFSEPTPTSSHSSKKYKATDSKDTAEKITGSGKKGSTRTIVPEEGRKVANVIVTDKDGNEIDVTMNADGTYSFKQPASNVDVLVSYKNREITLNIGSTEASVDGERENLDVCPVIRNDRTMLPIRFVAENLGAKVEWSEKNPNYVVITRGDTKIEITLGSDIMKVNGKDVKLDSVAFAENDRTYLPVRAVSEALNAIVEWHENEPSVVKIYERQ